MCLPVDSNEVSSNCQEHTSAIVLETMEPLTEPRARRTGRRARLGAAALMKAILAM